MGVFVIFFIYLLVGVGCVQVRVCPWTRKEDYDDKIESVGESQRLTEREMYPTSISPRLIMTSLWTRPTMTETWVRTEH